MTTLTLPYPPSANRLWRAVKGRQIKSADYRAWLTRAALSVALQRPTPVTGAYRLTLVATRPDNRARDIDNLIKPCGDLLVQCGVIPDDSKAKSVFAGWSDEPPSKEAAVHVLVEPA